MIDRCVAGVIVMTALGWTFFPMMEEYVGELGMLTMVPLVLLFGSGLMTKEDLSEVEWPLLLLLGGGVSLGKSVKASGVLRQLTATLQQLVGDSRPLAIASLVNAVVMVVANFVSHTVGAITMLPIVANLDSSPAVLVVGATLCDTGACLLPVSRCARSLPFSAFALTLTTGGAVSPTC